MCLFTSYMRIIKSHFRFTRPFRLKKNSNSFRFFYFLVEKKMLRGLLENMETKMEYFYQLHLMGV